MCEGEKTEPTYFDDLRHDQRLSSANVIVTGESNSDPESVVDFGLDEFERDGDDDRLFCVIDRDTHDGFDAALRTLREADANTHAIVSHPCFEYWILLHFENTAAPYDHPESPCKDVKSDVEKHIHNYEKGMRGLFERLKPKLKKAAERSGARWKQAKASGSFNPSTKVHTLVRHLFGLRKTGP